MHKICGCIRTTIGDLARHGGRRIERPACRATSCISLTCYASRDASLPVICQIDIMRRNYIVDCCQDAERCLGCAEFTSEGSRVSARCALPNRQAAALPRPLSFQACFDHAKHFNEPAKQVVPGTRECSLWIT